MLPNEKGGDSHRKEKIGVLETAIEVKWGDILEGLLAIFWPCRPY
jgi:hypothetical protein